jgi:hypothetical protein
VRATMHHRRTAVDEEIDKPIFGMQNPQRRSRRRTQRAAVVARWWWWARTRPGDSPKTLNRQATKRDASHITHVPWYHSTVHTLSVCVPQFLSVSLSLSACLSLSVSLCLSLSA